MANRLINPFHQYVEEDGTPIAGGSLEFYASGTDTPLPVYSDVDLATSVGVVVQLNAAGRPSTAIFLQNLPYKVRLLRANNTEVWTADPVSTSDYTATAKIQSYNGNPNGNVAGTAGNGTLPADMVWDFANGIMYVCSATGVAATAVWTAINASAAVPVVLQPQGYLTTIPNEPVISADSISATGVHYVPFVGNLAPIFNGSTMVPIAFTTQTLALAASHAANTIYDMFITLVGDVPTLVTGPAWSSSTTGLSARGTGASTTELTRLQGLLVNAVQITGRNGGSTFTVGSNRGTYLGSILIDGTNGQVTCHRSWGQNRKWGVWNAYNRRPIILKAGDATSSWTYESNTLRASNADSSNKLTVLTGLAEETFDITFEQNIDCGSASAATNVNEQAKIGIGVNSATVASGRMGTVRSSGSTSSGGNLGMSVGACPTAHHILTPTLGIQNIHATEIVPADTANHSVTFYGGEDDMILSARYNG